ncbi:hypothetical protein RSC3_00610 [Bacillus paralicheniformis]|nr:hypothetical protein RSC3_00610 [Bacillus paralicheniformis]
MAAVILAAGAFAAFRYFVPEKAEPAKGGGSDLLVSITDQKLMTAYYENQNKLYEEKMTDYPAAALDRKKRILYYTNTDNSNMKHLIRLDLQSGEKTTLYSGMNMSTDSVYRRMVRSCSCDTTLRRREIFTSLPLI